MKALKAFDDRPPVGERYHCVPCSLWDLRELIYPGPEDDELPEDLPLCPRCKRPVEIEEIYDD